MTTYTAIWDFGARRVDGVTFAEALVAIRGKVGCPSLHSSNAEGEYFTNGSTVWHDGLTAEEREQVNEAIGR